MVSPDLIIIKRWSVKQFVLLAVACLLLLALVAVTGYLFGISDALSLNQKNLQLSQQIDTLNQKLEEGERSLVMQQQISKVDKAANLHAGSSMDSQLQQIRELERELNFFRSIMAPEETAKGLQVSRFNWQAMENGEINWQLSLIQAGSQGRAISGVVTIELVAMQGNQRVTIPVTNNNQKTNFDYRFKYFQHLTGLLTVPEGLIPLSIDVVAKPALKGQQSVTKSFPWQTDEEKVANVE